MATPEQNMKRREQYRARARWRVVVDFSRDVASDVTSIDYLYEVVGRGGIARFIRDAVAEKIARETGQQPTAQQPAPDTYDMLKVLSGEVLRLKNQVAELSSAPRQQVPPGEGVPTVGSLDMGPRQQVPPGEGVLNSGGLDMGPRRSRRGNGIPPTLPASAPAPAGARVHPAAQANPALVLAESIRQAGAVLRG